MSPSSISGGFRLGFQTVSTFLPPRWNAAEVRKFFYSRKIFFELMRYKHTLQNNI